MVDINSLEEGRWKERLLIQEPREGKSKIFEKFKWPVALREDVVCSW